VSDAPPSATAAASAATSEAAAGVLQLYRRQLDERHLHSDSAQLVVVAKLDDLRRRLIAQRRAPRVRLPRWLTGLAPAVARAPLTGLYLWGGVGRGKTWLMDLFVATLPFAQARRVHFHRFMYDVHAQLAQIRQQHSPLEHIARALAHDTRVLCFDELYVSDIADAMILGGLFDGLFRRGVTLVATSNVPPGELYKEGLQRQRFLPAIRLLERHLEVARLAGVTDYRLRQLTQAGGIYLSAGAPDTGARLAALFAALADHHTQAGGVIEIEGRPIAVIRAGAGAVWFDFEALCATPRSQNDYIEIAREYQSVIVADVPALDAARDDEARRFIALIDEFYDRNVNLIVSAAAPAAQLYRGERLRGLFARTASRLIEMQSEEYLAREHRP
jgi:cell division protein ZapE